MSKAKLKKELEGMTSEQLVDIVLNVYSARKEAKEYFEFFLNPDCDKLLDKYKDKIKKEIIRAKRGQAKFRISNIKRMIKDFESFDPGAEYVLRLMCYSFSCMMLYSVLFQYNDIQDKATENMAREILEYGDSHLLFDQAAKAIDNVLNNDRGSASYLRRQVRQALDVKEVR